MQCSTHWRELPLLPVLQEALGVALWWRAESMARISSDIGIKDGGQSHSLIPPPCEVDWFANGDTFEAVDAERDGLGMHG